MEISTQLEIYFLGWAVGVVVITLAYKFYR